jgi:hypothetical protein
MIKIHEQRVTRAAEEKARAAAEDARATAAHTYRFDPESEVQKPRLSNWRFGASR